MPERLNPTPPELLVPTDIGIIGYGIVGQALAYGFNQSSQGRDRIRHFDIDPKKDGLPLDEVVSKSEIVFICLPTPMKSDESGIDLSIIDRNIETITPQTDDTDKLVVIKSTVIPGTTNRYIKEYQRTRLAFNPEFLTEAHYMDDFMSADRTIIGADNDLTARRLGVLYSSHFPNSEIFFTDPTSAEMVKISANALLASRVTMANVLYDLCGALGIEWDAVKDMISADPRIGSSHLDVTSLRGWGGKCFPKDWVNLMGQCRELGVDAKVLEVIWRDNKKRRKKHDWEEIPFAVSSDKDS